MTTYTAITNGEIDAESPLTAALFTLIRDNPIAITEGATGAPKIQTAALEQTGSSEAVTTACLRDAAVTRAKISTSTVSMSGAISSGGAADVTLANPYAFFPMIHGVGGTSGTVTVEAHGTDADDPDSPRFWLRDEGLGGSGSYDVDYRYIVA